MGTDSSAEAAARDPAAGPAGGGAPFPYMRWAKAYLRWEETTLGMSGLAPLTAEERAGLGLAPPPEIDDPGALLKAALAERYALAPANVHVASGTSHANFVTYLAFARGAHVAAETPAYEALHGLAAAVGATLSPFRRVPEDGWRIDRAALAGAVKPETGLIVVTDLHNPSGKRLHPEDLDLLLEHAHTCDACVLVDEVYADFDPQPRPTAAHRDPRVLVTNSLTKTHGLPDLRAGWVLGSEEHIGTIEAWDDLVHPAQPPATMLEAARYIPQASARLAATRSRAADRAAQVGAWVDATPRVRWVEPDGGITGFVGLGEPGAELDGDLVAARVHERFGVRVVPGSFFQAPGWLRVSFMQEPAHLAHALDAVGTVVGAM